jgi:polysaccharide deacetylase family protein (PEP-CTERM system associated)
VREIADRGHEVASHGCYHNLPTKMPLDSFYSELTDSRKRLEDTIGRPVNGFRAPSFAIDDGILAAIAKAGYRYDSSYNSFHLHGRYGKIALNGHVKIGIARRISEQFYELPISNLAMFGNQLPLGGGAYFRIFPFLLFQIGVKRILRQDNAYLFYIHPWEIDAEQPRVATASWIRKIRHYSNISKTCDRLQKMIRNFNQCNFTSCSQYIDIQTNGLTTSGVR